MSDTIGKTGRNEQTRRIKRIRAYVVLLNWNGWRDTQACLESVYRCVGAGRFREGLYRVVVCDNNSSDGSVGRIEAWAGGGVDNALEDPLRDSLPEALRPLVSPPVTKPVVMMRFTRAEAEQFCNAPMGSVVLPEGVSLVVVENGENRGFAAGNNPGVRFALADGADYIWLLNNDTVITAQALERLVEYMEARPGVGAAGTAIYFAGAPERLQTWGGGRLTRWLGRDVFTPEGTTVQYICGTSMFLRREALLQTGLLDEGFFFYWEDADLSRRIAQRGWELAVVGEAKIYHRFSASVGGGSLNSDIYRASALIRYFRKHRVFWPFPVAAHISGMLFNRLFRGQFNRLWPVFRQLRHCFGALHKE